MTKLRRIAQAVEDLKTLEILKEEDRILVDFSSMSQTFTLIIFVKKSTGKQIKIRNILMEEFSGNIKLSHSNDNFIEFIIK